MIETRLPEATLHVKMCPRREQPGRPDVMFAIVPVYPWLPQSIPVMMPYDQAKTLAAQLQIQLLAFEMLGDKPQEGPREPLWTRLWRKAERWAGR